MLYLGVFGGPAALGSGLVVTNQSPKYFRIFLGLYKTNNSNLKPSLRGFQGINLIHMKIVNSIKSRPDCTVDEKLKAFVRGKMTSGSGLSVFRTNHGLVKMPLNIH